MATTSYPRTPGPNIHGVAAQRVFGNGGVDFTGKNFSVSGEMPKLTHEGVGTPNFGITSAGAKAPMVGMVNEGLGSRGAGGELAQSFLTWGGKR